MPFLLDTHVILWALEDGSQLSPTARQLMADPANELLISETSLFEIVIKLKTNKLNLKSGLQEFLDEAMRQRFTWLPIRNDHLLTYDRIPLHPDHRDPFDRLILAVAVQENLPVISSDKKFGWYLDLVRVIW